MILERAADQHLVLPDQRRGQRVALEAAQLAAVEGEVLRLAAIETMASIRPRQAAGILLDLTDLDDDDIVEAAHEALAIAGVLSEEDPDEPLL